jgi:hypothetical protein
MGLISPLDEDEPEPPPPEPPAMLSPLLLGLISNASTSPLTLGKKAAAVMPALARASATRTVAVSTSRFCAAARCSSESSSGSWKLCHHSMSIGSGAGWLAPCPGARPTNQEMGL